jgi:hypothetical protein
MASIDDPGYWHGRAEEARAKADEMKHQESKHTLLEIAKSYDLLAQQAEQRQERGSARR